MHPIDSVPMKLSSLYPDLERLMLFVAFEEADAEIEPNYQQIIFTGDSIAAFRLDCSRDECVGGGFDFASSIDELVRSGELQANGKLACQGSLAGDSENQCCALQAEYRIIVQRNP